MNWKARLPVLAAALWWGSLGAIGFLAVPLLFANASSPAVAGQLAARLFRGECWLGLACGFLVLMSARDEEGTPKMDWAGGAIVYVLAGMLAALLQEFAVAPHIVARENLAFWHGAGTVLYALQWVCALVVLWKSMTVLAAVIPAQAGIQGVGSESASAGSPPGRG
jgi:hypothetical protein